MDAELALFVPPREVPLDEGLVSGGRQNHVVLLRGGGNSGYPAAVTPELARKNKRVSLLIGHRDLK